MKGLGEGIATAAICFALLFGCNNDLSTALAHRVEFGAKLP